VYRNIVTELLLYPDCGRRRLPLCPHLYT